MATKSVVFCDHCDHPSSDTRKVLPQMFDDKIPDLCFDCAVGVLKKMYGIEGPVPRQPVETQTPADLSPETKSFNARREELFEEHGTVIFVAKPTVDVSPGSVISYGDPARSIQIIEPVAGKPGEWFIKLA